MNEDIEDGYKEVDPDNIRYIHSKCCMAHWELVYNIEEKEYGLFCEKCGKPAGLFFVSNEELSNEELDTECEHCKDKGDCDQLSNFSLDNSEQ